MNFEEILKRASEEIDEILSLKKSIDENMAKEVEEKPEMAEAPSDAQEDLLHNADAHSEEGDVSSYASKLSDEELYELLSALSEEAEQRGVGQDQNQEMEQENEEESSQEETEKAAPEMEEASDDMAPPAEAMAEQEELSEAPETMEQPEPEASSEEPSEAAPAEEAAPEAPAEEAGEEASIESKIAELADDELGLLLQAVSAELEARQGGQPAEGGEASLAASMEKSKEEKEAEHKEPAKEEMKKSVADENIENLKKSIEELESVMESVSKKSFADSRVKVLEKSVAEEETTGPLLGTDLQNWLLSEQKAGKKKVGSDLVVKAGLVKSEEMAESFYAELRSIGLTPPKK